MTDEYIRGEDAIEEINKWMDSVSCRPFRGNARRTARTEG